MQANTERLSSASPDVSILVPAYNQVRYTLSCLVSLLHHRSNYSIEILIGDDRSTDATSRLGDLSGPGVRCIRHPQNLGFLRNCNAIAAEARGRYLVLLNNDTVTLPGWLDELIDTLEEDPGIGLVGSKLVYPDGRLQEAGSIMWDDASGWNWGNLEDPLDPAFQLSSRCGLLLRCLHRVVVAAMAQFEWIRRRACRTPAMKTRTRRFGCVRSWVFGSFASPCPTSVCSRGVSSGRSLDAGIKQFQNTNRPLFVERWQLVLAAHGTASEHPKNFLDRTRSKKLLLIDWVTPRRNRIGFRLSWMPSATCGSSSAWGSASPFCPSATVPQILMFEPFSGSA